MSIQLSVIVPSFRRHDELERCLDDLAAQANPPSLEVVLVLQAYPVGAAAAIKKRFAGHLDLAIGEFGHGLGTGGARNEGLRRSTGAIVAFLDDDVRLPKEWARAVVECYNDPAIGGAGGFVDHPGHYNPVRNTMYRLLGITSNRFKIDWGGFNVGPAFNPPGVQRAEWLGGGNMSFRREAILGVGGFDEALGAFWHEDADVTNRVMRSGWKVISSDRVTVEHFPSLVNRPPLRSQVLERERTRVLFVWKAIGGRPFWRTRYACRLALHALAMSVVGIVKRDPLIPVNVLRGGWSGYRALAATRRDSADRARAASPPIDAEARV